MQQLTHHFWGYLRNRLLRGKPPPVVDVAVSDDVMDRLSHEIRTSLTGVMGYAEFIEHGAEPAMAAFTAKIIRESSQDLTRAIEAFVELYQARREDFPLSFGEFCPTHLLHQMILAHQTLADRLDVSLIFHATDEAQLLTIYSDEARYTQMMNALLWAVLKGATRSAMVVVSAQLKADTQTFFVLVEELGGSAHQRQSKLLSQFWNLADYTFCKQEGPGIVMAFAKQLLIRLGGQSHFKSIKGQGDQLMLSLPVNFKRTSGGTLQ